MVARLGKVKKKQCYLELFKYLRTNGVPHTINNNGVFFTRNDLVHSVVYKLDEIITKCE